MWSPPSGRKNRPATLRGGFSLAAGLALCTAFAPFSWYAVAPPLIAAVMALWSAAPSRTRAFFDGWLFGFAYFAGSTYWMYYSVHDYGGAPPAAAVLAVVLLSGALALYTGALAACLHFARSAPPALALWIRPSLWFLFEWLRGELLSSFAWNLLGQSLVDSPLSGVLPVVGVYGAGWMLVFVGVALFEAVRRKSPARLLAALVVFASAAAASSVEWTRATGEAVRVTVLQAGVEQSVRFTPEMVRETARIYAAMTRKAPDDTLVVWPEAAIPAPYDRLEARSIRPLVSSLAERGGALLGGAFVRDGGRTYNSLFYADGDETHFYHKRHLVPFGEYMPLRFLLNWLEQVVNIPMSDLAAGRAPPVMTIAGRKVGVSICYEATLTENIRDALPESVYLVNLSNDGWFGDSVAPQQHLDMARLRAMEFGRPMIRATTTGISAIINHQGEVLERSGQFTRHSMSGAVHPREGATPYTVLGNAPMLMSAFFAVGAMLWRSRAGVRRTDGDA